MPHSRKTRLSCTKSPCAASRLSTRTPYLPTDVAVGVAALTLICALLSGCAGNTDNTRLKQRLNTLLPADAILLGEQHDAADHQRLQRGFVEALAQRGQLAALVLEMAEHGTSTAALPRDATPQQVQAALRWNSAGWPWESYAPSVMAALQHGVPVLGANLPRDAMRAAMSDPQFDNHLVAAALARQREAIRIGHCDMLPAEQLMPMVRVQLARDASMADTIVAAMVPGKTVLMIAGAGHVLRDLGIPTHIPANLRIRTVLAVAGDTGIDVKTDADMVWQTPALPPRDHCAELGKQLKR